VARAALAERMKRKYRLHSCARCYDAGDVARLRETVPAAHPVEHAVFGGAAALALLRVPFGQPTGGKPNE
jgi:hypothetical protein